MKSAGRNINENSDSQIIELSFLTKVIKTAGREKLRKKIKSIGDNYFQIPKKTISDSSILKEIKTRIEELYISYFSPFENLITVRSGKSTNKLLQKAMSFYTLKNYQGTIKLLKKHIADNPEDPLSQFYLGVSLMETDKFDSASVIFRKIIKKGNPLLSDHAKWYLALSNLKKFKLEEAITVLNEISEKTSYSRKINNLKKKISAL